jgi:hypothetical protein
MHTVTGNMNMGLVSSVPRDMDYIRASSVFRLSCVDSGLDGPIPCPGCFTNCIKRFIVLEINSKLEKARRPILQRQKKRKKELWCY